MFSASIVLYNHSVKEIEPLVTSLKQCDSIEDIFLIDNSEQQNNDFSLLPVTYIFNNKNLGYGKAHNIAIRKTIEQNIPFHLVINPDVEVEPEAINEITLYMKKHKDVGQIMPKVLYPNGEIQYLCKQLPKPKDLLFRRFFPDHFFRKSKEHFELRASGYNQIMEVPYLSGCFMFLRTDALKEVGLFDERFFMYPEDIDLTRRIHKKYKTIFYPSVSIIHYHTQGSYKTTKMLFVHLWNLVKYFNKWGWFFDEERKKVNENVLKKLKML